MSYTLPKRIVVKQNRDFQRIYKHGRSLANKNMVIYFCRAFHPHQKAAFAAGKRLGCAAVRNRVKRLLREAYRLHRGELSGEYCVLLVGRAAAAEAKAADVEKSFCSLCRRAGILKKEVKEQ